jgi:FtsH-binding integral membrane protein
MAISKTADSTISKIDLGLRDHMINVYNQMGIGLAISGVVAYLVSSVPALTALFLGGPQVWLFILAPLAMVFWLSWKINSLSVSTARTAFYAYAGLMGISLSTLFLVYEMGSIVQVFLITAVMFLAMSIYGYTTKKDLTSLGSFLFMGLIGLIVASIVNLFMQSSALAFAISCIGVLIFTGLTAYDTQKIKELYYHTDGDDRTKAGIMGALTLYLDFINLMIHLLQLLGQRK